MTDIPLEAVSIAEAFSRKLRPVKDMLPSQFAETYRKLKPGTTSRPGLWSNDVFPYLIAIMDAFAEAIRTGKNVVLMKSGQGGGSEAIINVVAWLIYMYGGPILYLISKDEIAKTFGEERFGYLMRHCAPLAEKAFVGRSQGEKIQVKRFTDSKIAIYGSKSFSNLESNPYAFVFIDEIDSAQKEIGGQDLIEAAEVRTSAWSGKTLICVFAHPTTKERGAGRQYYQFSDQRRPFVECPHCGQDLELTWNNVHPLGEEDQTEKEAERDPSCYKFVAPCCGSVVTDTERRIAIHRGVKQQSVLPQHEAKRTEWIGLHFNQLCMPNISLHELAVIKVRGLDDPGVDRVFQNKRMGDTYEIDVNIASAEEWERLIYKPEDVHDPHAWYRGEIPPGVRYLTAGQDSRSTELHWTIWGWGHVPAEDGSTRFCGWLIDCGVESRDYDLTLHVEDLKTLDDKLYDRSFHVKHNAGHSIFVTAGFHDSGWQTIPVYEYCRAQKRAMPCKGASLNESQAAKAAVTWGHIPPYEHRGKRIKSKNKLAVLNTFALKSTWFAKPTRQFTDTQGVERVEIRLPIDTPEDFIKQSSSEYLGEDRGGKVWKRRGPNHYSDCNVYAFAAAMNLKAFNRRAKAHELVPGAAQPTETTGKPKRRGYKRAGDNDSGDGRKWQIGR